MTPTAPCTWPTDICPCDEEVTAEDTAAASYLLWAATGKVFGPCPVSVLPCVSSICGLCRNPLRDCGCSSVPEIRLNGPIAEIIEVVIDGVALPETSYRVDDYEWLVRLDGGSWPSGSDFLDPDSFRVDYLLGIPPPDGAGAATAELACEIAKARCGNAGCRLPSNIRSYTRQGVNVVFGPGDFGLFMVDKWVSAALSPVLAGAIHSPDIPQPRQITWEATSP